MAEVHLRERRCIAMLYPVGHLSSDVFALGSAYLSPEGAS
jgi:hypothetical protein